MDPSPAPRVREQDHCYIGALNVAITVRVLIHETDRSRSLLSRVNSNYWDLAIHHRPVFNPTAVFAVPLTIEIGDDGTRKVIRTNLDSPPYQLVPAPSVVERRVSAYRRPAVVKERHYPYSCG